MLSCWKEPPDERPTFTKICKSLIPILEGTNSQYNYMNAVQNVDIQMEELDGEFNV
jgi:hypothetical protein